MNRYSFFPWRHARWEPGAAGGGARPGRAGDAPGKALRGVAHYTRINGLRLHWVEWPGAGEADPVLLVHGLTASARSLAGIAGALAPARRAIAPDLRGRGRSDKPRQGYSLAHHAADLVALLDALGIARVALIGYSLGALIGVYLAAHVPERVARLVLIDAGTDARPELRAMIRPLAARLELVYPSLPLFLLGTRNLPSFQPWTPTLALALADGLKTLPGGRVRARTPRHVAEEEIDTQAGFNLRALHGRVRAPTLILRARDGLAPGLPPVLTPDEAAGIARAIPEATTIDIPANHYTIAMSGRADVNAAIRTFLRNG